MKFIIKHLQFLIAIQFSVLLLHAQSNYFNNNLHYGKYYVGFKTIYTHDLSRAAVAEQPANQKKGRFMQVNIWYPAKHPGTAKPMQYKEYIDLLAFQTSKEVKNATAIATKQFFNNVAELKGDTSLLRKHFAILSESKTKAYKNAGAATGSFPLVIYSDYASNQNILCEYLASHGYIVVSTPMKGTYSAGFDYFIAGIESGVADLQFALAITRKEFPVRQSFAIMGLGITATTALGLQMRNPDAAGVISLEGGITTTFEFDLIRKSNYFDITRINKPILVIHAPHPDVKPELTNAYKYADRWLISFPQSSEFYFLNYGVWEAAMKGILGKAPGDTRSGFESASMYVLNYLNTIFNDKEKRFVSLNVSEAIARPSFKKGVPLPPSVDELVSIFIEKGIDEVKDIYKERKQADPEPFSFTTFYKVAEHLLGQKDFSRAAAWTSLFAEAFPFAAAPWFMSGRCQLELNNKKLAKDYYHKALTLLAGDKELSGAEKDFYKPIIEKRITELEG
jgi:hypothetical protein